MKKIALSIIPFMFSFAVFSQQSDNTKATEKQKPVTANKHASSKEALAPTLDGKKFNITFLSKKDEMNSTAGSKMTGEKKNLKADDQTILGVNETNTNTAATSTSQPGTGNMNSSGETAIPDKTNAKLKFENGMVTITVSTETAAMEACHYQVTTGTADFATFISKCSTVTSQVTTTSVNTGQDQPADKTGLNVTGTVVNDNQVGGVTDVNTNTNVNTTAVTTPAPAVTEQSGPVYIMTGFVNGKSISGTIIFRNGKESATYSYEGTADLKKDKRDKGDLGLNK